MAGQHCFISYSNRDAENFGPQLSLELEGEHPYLETWYDKKDIPAGQKWDSIIHKAVSDCKCFLFVVTRDSVIDDSICMKELSLALSYKKPIFPICLEADVEFPWRVMDFQRIDFCGNHRKGMAQLRLAIQRVNSPEGQLDALRERLAVAERDLHNAKDEAEKLRIKKDVEEFTDQIRVQERIVADPEAAKKQTEQNIQNGLERERKPQLPVASFQSSKFINQPPGVAQNYFQDRLMETEQAILFLKNEAQRILTVVGRGGAGKTAMVCRLLKYIENGGLPDDYDIKHDKVDIDGIVYLSEAGSRKVNFANLFEDLCKLLPAASAEKLSALYREPQTSTESKTVQLLAAFQGLKQVIVLLDNFENVVDAEKGQVRDAELDEALRAFLHAPHHPVKIIITTRVSARELDTFEPARQRLLPLDTGLQPEYAREAFVLMDEGNLVGIKNAGADLLNLAVTRTLGLPRALEALYAALRTDRFTTLQELLDLPILPEQVVQAYVGEAFNRLDTNAQKVMQALAVYNRPVTPAAVDYLLAPHLPAIDSAPILQRLANMHFARKESGRFYLHPVDREFAFGLIGNQVIRNQELGIRKQDSDSLQFLIPNQPIPNHLFTQHDLLTRAADYFAAARKPRAEWKKLDDLASQLAEFDLRCAAGDYDTATNVLIGVDDDYLLLWGHYRLIIDLHEKLQEKIKDKDLARVSLGNLGKALSFIGKVNQAISNYEKSLAMAREAKNRQAESTWLGNLGVAYADLGNARKAIEYYELQLTIAQEIGDKQQQAGAFGNLGSAYANLGDSPKVIEFYNQAMVMAQAIGDRSGEGKWIYGLGNCYANIGDVNKAIDFYKQALAILHEIADRNSEEGVLVNLGNAYNTLGDTGKAIEYYEKGLVIAQETGDRRGEGVCLSNIASQYSSIGEYGKAINYYHQALQNAREIGNKYGESKRLNGLAGVLIEKGDIKNAISNLQESLRIGQGMSSPEVCSGSGSTLAEAYLLQNDLVNARATIEAALQYDVPQYNHNASALHGIIALRQGDEVTARGAFVRAIGQADEILSKTAEYYSALDAKGLAICGLILAGRGDPSMPTETNDGKTVPPDKVTVSDGRVAPTVDDAIETFRKARKIAPHAGVVKSVLRLFDELVKCDTEGILKDVRGAVEGK